VYTVPSSTQAIVSSIFVSNLYIGQETSVSIAVRPAADTSTSDKHYIMRRNAIPANGTSVVTAGITLNTGDKVLVYASGSCAISVFGSEIA
jgi:hypothetical protein